MPIKSYKEAINEAIAQEMKKDENVILIGEDVAGGAGTNGEQDAWGGVMGVTKGRKIQKLFRMRKYFELCSSNNQTNDS